LKVLNISLISLLVLIDPWQNILEDKMGEKKFDFDLSASLHSACETPFLAGWIFHVTPNVLPPPPQMQGIYRFESIPS